MSNLIIAHVTLSILGVKGHYIYIYTSALGEARSYCMLICIILPMEGGLRVRPGRPWVARNKRHGANSCQRQLITILTADLIHQILVYV